MASASASSATRLCILACRQTPRLRAMPPRVHRVARGSSVPQRSLTTTRARWADEPPKEEKLKEAAREELVKEELEDASKSSGQKPASEGSAAPANPSASQGASSTSPSATSSSAQPFGNEPIEFQSYEILDATAKEHGYETFDAFVEGHLYKGPGAPQAEREFERRFNAAEQTKVEKRSFWFDEEDPEPDTEEVEDFDEDDMTEMAHAKLEEVKEMRHYARLAVWELPLLSKLAKPFKPPTDKQVLRWRYTTYFGDNHPAEKKVVVEFAPDDLGLTKVQTEKLKKLAGPRYNPEKGFVKMSCESYEQQAQNKRYLLDLVDDLIKTAKDPKDTFADVPLDTRHHEFTYKPRFPKEWLMTEERRRSLEQQRETLKLEEVQRIDSGKIVDGKQVIDSYLLEKMKEEQEKAARETVTVAAPARSNARSGMRRSK